ncbi:conserved protein of unknown function [Xenorhabdus poinarii G6]|uniref:Uncharacterized protein n=1 Tax=Xenorhabdus poinarii G6 TaxID=1354304 RepID=A0A068R3J7_9GAMM|nr:DUF2829 domain-containing protein [Xenorhabdus poinarii]CDG21614.1 conserved protein of unknown function [Xenorhabdus poinarii G6]
MSDVNKLDNKQFLFDPEQYRKNIAIDNIAPAGSFPWAIIKVYSGGQVYRKDWSASGEYIYLVAGDGNDIAPEVKMRDKHGILISWQPAQDDMMAHDWTLLKSVPKTDNGEPKIDNGMLSFDLTIGTGKFDDGRQNWGYLADEEWTSIGEYSFGDLTNFQNKTDIKEFSLFVWWANHPELDIRVSSDKTQDGYQKMKELFGKNLTVTSNGVSYFLGQATEGNKTGQKPYEFVGMYTNTDSKQLGALLKQNVGKTVHFCFNWK